MTVYKIRELQDRLCEMSEDGYLYAELYELEADEDGELPAELSFTAVTPDESIDYEPVEACKLTSDEDLLHDSFKPTDRCHEISFSYEEIATIHHALTNALEYFKDCEKDPQYSSDVKKKIKSSSVKCRNLQAKLIKFLNNVVPK